MTTTVTAKLRVLIVDDSRVMREMIARALGLSALPIASIDQAGDGAAALVAVRAKPYDLILLDLNMPGIDGRYVLGIIKGDPTLRSIPVVVLTTSTDRKDIEKCYDIGANSYIQKPVSFDGLTEAVSTMKDYWFNVAILPPHPSEI